MKNKTIIIWIAIIIIGIFGLLWLGGGNNASLPTESQLQRESLLTAPVSSHDFGSISMESGSVGVSFVVTNSSQEDTRIDSIVTSCMCTTAYIMDGDVKKGPFGMPGHGATVPKVNEIMQAGEERVVEIIFDPAAHGPAGVGLAERYVYLIDETGGVLQLKITANVTL
ncbi:MAG: DUF1573 domain-containing protein [Candidatus Zambryskibacteria bacterium]|nr:DUF1573 domain-containing protein [Candidatus Zambryskibacteria bacterium]